MKRYRVLDIIGYFNIFIDEEVEADDVVEAKEFILYEILDNIGNFIDIEVEEIEEEEEVLYDR